MSIIANILNNMSADDKAKLGKTGVKVNSDGEHKLTIKEAYEITSEGGAYPRFVLKLEDTEGKTIEWTGFLKQKVGKDDKGVVRAGEYSVNGVKTYLDTEGAEYDNVRVVGQLKNLWKVVGLDPNQFGAGIKADTVTFPTKGTVAIESWTALIGKQFTGVSSYVVSADSKDPNKCRRNQGLNMDALFNVDRLSLAEVESGKTEPTAILEAVKKAKAAASIKYSDRSNRACIQELKIIQGAGTVPVAESVGTATPGAAAGAPVKPF